MQTVCGAADFDKWLLDLHVYTKHDEHVRASVAEVLFRQESKFAVKCQFKAPVMSYVASDDSAIKCACLNFPLWGIKGLFYSKSKDVVCKRRKKSKSKYADFLNKKMNLCINHMCPLLQHISQNPLETWFDDRLDHVDEQ